MIGKVLAFAGLQVPWIGPKGARHVQTSLPICCLCRPFQPTFLCSNLLQKNPTFRVFEQKCAFKGEIWRSAFLQDLARFRAVGES